MRLRQLAADSLYIQLEYGNNGRSANFDPLIVCEKKQHFMIEFVVVREDNEQE